MTINVFLVDDQQLVRAGFSMLVGSQSDMTVVGEAGDGVAAIDALRRATADVVLMDVRMPRTRRRRCDPGDHVSRRSATGDRADHVRHRRVRL